MNRPFDPNAPGAAAELAARAGALIVHLNEVGIRPLADPVDLMLMSILPLAIKRCLGQSIAEQLAEADILDDLVSALDLTVLHRLIYGDES